MSSLSALGNNTAVNSLFSNSPTVSGLATGLDTNKIIQAILGVQQARINGLQARADQVIAKQTAFKGIEARLLGLQSQIFGLARSQNGVFELRTATSSNTNLVTAAATSSATAGVYNLRVSSLATAQQVASQGFESANAQITQGTIQIGSGSESATITIDSSNDTLQGLVNAINGADVGVSAGIINDGSGVGNQPNRLILTANETGTANTITLVNNLAADGGTATKPNFDATYIGAANKDLDYSGTAAVTANSGAGTYSGTSNNSYQFTVINGGTVGTDDNLQIAFTDSTGTNTGTITINSGDADVFKTVAQGIQLKLAAGTLVAGETFTIKAYVPTLQQATNATVSLGSGNGALTLQSATNQISDLIDGVTLDLHDADPTKFLTLTVAKDTAQAEESIKSFVGAYNDLMKFIDEQTHFDALTNQAGILLGNFQATQLQDQVRNVMGSLVANVNPKMNRLSALGIALDNQARLTIDQSKLSSALKGQVASVSLDDVRRLFALTATSSSQNIEFVTASVKTKTSATPYQVSITQAAQQASMSATNALASSIVLDSSHNTFGLTVDGFATGTITLNEGTYTQTALAQAVQTKINAQPNLAGRQVNVSVDSGKLVVTSNSYGTTSTVSIGAGTALSDLGFTGTETAVGQDVVGSYLVNGVTETATGTGQFLVGGSSNANTADLQVRVTLTSAQVGAGVQSDIAVSRGLASIMDVAVNRMLDPVNGRLKAIDDSFQSIEDDMQSQIKRQNEALQARQQALALQFVAMEQAVNRLQGIGNYLTTQFTQLLQQKS